jgi:hypothetical protein
MSTVTERITGNFPAIAAGTDQSTTIAESHVAGIVKAATITVNGNVTANGSTYRTFTLVNKGQDGNGTTAIAVFATDTPTTDDIADFDEKALTLSSTAADLVVAKGDILALVETHASTGVAHSGGRVEIEIERTA